MKIADVIGHSESDKMKKFKGSIKGKSKAEIRQMEMEFFQAQPIKKFLGARAGKGEIVRRTMKIVFRNESEITEVMSKIMTVNTYLGYNSYDVDRLLKLIKFSNRKLKYNEEKKDFEIKKKRKLRKRNS